MVSAVSAAVLATAAAMADPADCVELMPAAVADSAAASLALSAAVFATTLLAYTISEAACASTDATLEDSDCTEAAWLASL